MKNYKDLFLLNPDIIYLNHGSFGACPKEVMEKYFDLQLKLENQPIDFLDNNIKSKLREARKALSTYIDCDSEDLVFFPNPSTALNMVIKSLKINKGDEILTTTHEYGALIKTWKFICDRNSAKYVEVNPVLPLDSKDDFLNQFFDKITDRTKVIFISHITSPTAIIFPIKEICEEARRRGIVSIVDGAHAPAHIDFSIKSINPDIYVGACHKWMLSPKGSSFLYAKRDMQNDLNPLVISWGWDNDPPVETPFLDNNQWQGTNDISQYLVIPFVINFLKKNKWEIVSDHCKKINLKSRNKLLNLFNEGVLCHNAQDWLGQMSSIFLPDCDTIDLYKFLKSENIEIPILEWNKYKILRISIQAYNTSSDIDILINKLQRYFKL